MQFCVGQKTEPENTLRLSAVMSSSNVSVCTYIGAKYIQ